jgi:long-chain acyl-CoA synthetase
MINNLNRLFDLVYHQQEKFPQKAAIAAKHLDGHFYSFSTQTFIKHINQVSLGLLQIGLQKGDTIALISHNNRPEWNIMDLGMQQIGVVNVPVYPTISPTDYAYIFNEAQIKYCFVGGGDLLDKMLKAQPNIPSLRGIFTFDELPSKTLDANGQEVHHWSTIFSEADLAPVEKIRSTIVPTDLATIIYTSGTTGNPKGVMLSHKNILTNIQDVYPILPIRAGEIGLSFLPLCHIFERTVTYAYMSKGVNIIYPPSLDTLSESLQEFKPHFFTTVPRLLEKVYEKIVTKSKSEPQWKQSIFNWAEGLTQDFEFDPKRSFLESIKWKLADKAVFSKIRERLGGRLRGIVTGAAACPRKMAQFFSAVGIPIREGYGLTETSPAIAINTFAPYGALLGTVGPLLDSVKVKIDTSDGAYQPEEGEILVKGGNVMSGYYKQPEKTAEVFDKDGWFKTGDIGKFVLNSKGVQFLKITDRKKELLKTSNGKYVAPTPIESDLKADFLIDQTMIVGDNQKFVSALISPNFVTLREWATQNAPEAATLANPELIKNPKVLAYYQAFIDALNPKFGHVEQIKKFALVPDTWSVDSGELTPTLKLKRRVVLAKYQPIIDKIYQ